MDKLLKYESNIQNLKDQISEYEKKIEENDNMIKKNQELLNTQISITGDITFTKNELQSKNENLVKEMDELKKEVDEKQARIEKNEAERQKTENTIVSLNKRVYYLQNELDAFCPSEKLSTKRKRLDTGSSKIFKFSDPFIEENAFGWDDTGTEQIDVEMRNESQYPTESDVDILNRCILEKDSYVQKLEECKKELEDLKKLTTDASYVTLTSKQKTKLSYTNFKLLFIAFFEHHFKKLSNPEKLNLIEEDQKLLADLKHLLKEIQSETKDNYTHILSIYIQKQISTLDKTQTPTHFDKLHTINELLTYTLNKTESFLTTFKANLEMEKSLKQYFYGLILPKETVQESMIDIMSIFQYLKSIFDTSVIVDIKSKLKRLDELINEVFPKFYEKTEAAEKPDFLSYMLENFKTQVS